VQVWRVEGGRVQPLDAADGPWHPPLQETAGHAAQTPAGDAWLEPIPESAGYWVQLGPDAGDAAERPARGRAAALVLGEILRGEREAGLVAGELATRYEEIDLLYTIADILGRTVRLDEATQTIAREVADVVGARRASIMVYDEATNSLRMVAGRGLERFHTDPVPVDDPTSIAARVFRERRMMSFDASAPEPHPGSGAERGYKGTSFLALPIIYQPPGGEPHPIGVINLTDRIGADSFTAGHKKLLTAIANQIGAAIENARLVEGERRRVRLDTELILAHNLQSVLMQPQPSLARGTDLGARTQSAEVVGGDFYKFLRVRNAVGLLAGDVSSHGLSAAMLMTHVIAAAGIIAQAAQAPERALRKLLEALGEELTRAEMHVSIFYGIIDKRRGTLQYANAGHPQAFLLSAEGDAARLAATAPPLGLGDLTGIAGNTVPWHAGRDMLCLFSDGFSETANAAGERYGEERLLALIRRHIERKAPAIVDAAFEDVAEFAGAGVPAADDRTLVLVRR
jgi:sigma-B regulation protein RsbU (phosphoserine phosphatase)